MKSPNSEDQDVEYGEHPASLIVISESKPVQDGYTSPYGISSLFDVLPIPITPRVHQLVHYGTFPVNVPVASLSRGRKLCEMIVCLGSTTLDCGQLTLHFIGAKNGVRTSGHADPHCSFASQIGCSAALLYVTLSFYVAYLSRGEEIGNMESERYLQLAVSVINRALADFKSTQLPDGTIAAVACMTNMKVRDI